MPTCPRCETLPSCPPCAGRLLLAAPMDPTLDKLLAILRGRDLHPTIHGPLTIEIDLACDTLEKIRDDVLQQLGALEQRDTQCVLLPTGEILTPQKLGSVQSLASLLQQQTTQWFDTMLGEQRLSTAFQPIVRCNDGQVVYGHECLLRGRGSDDEIIYPGEIFAAAEASNRLFYLDRVARITSIRNARLAQLPGKVFVNFQPSAIYDPTFCLRTTMDAIWKAGFLPDQIVFEVVETDEISDVNHLLSILSYYRDAGFRIALDDVGTGYSTLSLLGDLNPNYVKVDRSLVEGIREQPHKEIIAAKLLDIARQLQITTIVEGIETEDQWRWCQEHEVDLVQGYFFGRPEIPETQTLGIGF